MGKDEGSKAERIGDLVCNLTSLSEDDNKPVTNKDVETLFKRGWETIRASDGIQSKRSIFTDALLLSIGTIYLGAEVHEAFYYVGGLLTLFNIGRELNNRATKMHTFECLDRMFFDAYSRTSEKARREDLARELREYSRK